MLEEMLIIDLETGGLSPELGIFEAAVLAIKNQEIIDKLHIGIVVDSDNIHKGYGAGYDEISTNEECINQFKDFLAKYPYPLVAHNGAFDRKFLIYYSWIDDDYPFYDTIRAFKLKMPGLFSYSMSTLIDFYELNIIQKHTAIRDVELLWDLIKIIQPDIWIPIGQSLKRTNKKKQQVTIHENKNLSAIYTDFEIIRDIFKGRNIVFTGKGPYTRNNLMELAKKCGADISSNSITKKTNLLVVGEGAGSKLQKATDLGIEIMDMSDFFEMTSGIALEQSTSTDNNISVDAPISDAFKNEVISFVPMKVAMAEKLSNLVRQHGGIANNRYSKKTTMLVYQLHSMSTEDQYVSIEKARANGIPTLTLGHFNRIFLERIK